MMDALQHAQYKLVVRIAVVLDGNFLLLTIHVVLYVVMASRLEINNVMMVIQLIMMGVHLYV